MELKDDLRVKEKKLACTCNFSEKEWKKFYDIFKEHRLAVSKCKQNSDASVGAPCYPMDEFKAMREERNKKPASEFEKIVNEVLDDSEDMYVRDSTHTKEVTKNIDAIFRDIIREIERRKDKAEMKAEMKAVFVRLKKNDEQLKTQADENQARMEELKNNQTKMEAKMEAKISEILKILKRKGKHNEEEEEDNEEEETDGKRSRKEN